MANQTLPAWRDLSRSRRIKVASNLIQTLDEHAFLLLSVLDQPEVIQESTNEIGNDLIRFKVHYEVIRLYLLNLYLLKQVYPKKASIFCYTLPMYIFRNECVFHN